MLVSPRLLPALGVEPASRHSLEEASRAAAFRRACAGPAGRGFAGIARRHCACPASAGVVIPGWGACGVISCTLAEEPSAAPCANGCPLQALVGETARCCGVRLMPLRVRRSALGRVHAGPGTGANGQRPCRSLQRLCPSEGLDQVRNRRSQIQTSDHRHLRVSIRSFWWSRWTQVMSRPANMSRIGDDVGRALLELRSNSRGVL